MAMGDREDAAPDLSADRVRGDAQCLRELRDAHEVAGYFEAVRRVSPLLGERPFGFFKPHALHCLLPFAHSSRLASEARVRSAGHSRRSSRVNRRPERSRAAANRPLVYWPELFALVEFASASSRGERF